MACKSGYIYALQSLPRIKSNANMFPVLTNPICFLLIFFLNVIILNLTNAQHILWKSKKRVTSYEFKSTSFEFKPMSYEFKSISYECKAMSYEFKSMSYKTKSTSCMTKSARWEIKHEFGD